MDFKLYSSKKQINILKFNDTINQVDFYSSEREEVGIFHYNQMFENVYHVVFYINEEYVTGSKFVKQISSVPMNVYVNTFIFIDNNKLFIENIYNEYCELVKNKINNLFETLFEVQGFSQEYFINTINKNARKILQCDFEEDGLLIKKENKNEILDFCKENKTIYYINFTLDVETYKNILVSIKADGCINVNVNIPIVLVNMLEYLIGDKMSE